MLDMNNDHKATYQKIWEKYQLNTGALDDVIEALEPDVIRNPLKKGAGTLVSLNCPFTNDAEMYLCIFGLTEHSEEDEDIEEVVGLVTSSVAAHAMTTHYEMV